MIDLDNLRTASLYINNQLLSRGLLRDGQTIHFAHPGDTDSQLADTMGKIMGVVNDLILRRDVSNAPLSSFGWETNHTIHSAMLTTANLCQQHCAHFVPSLCAKPTTSSSFATSKPRPSARQALRKQPRHRCAHN